MKNKKSIDESLNMLSFIKLRTTSANKRQIQNLSYVNNDNL